MACKQQSRRRRLHSSPPAPREREIRTHPSPEGTATASDVCSGRGRGRSPEAPGPRGLSGSDRDDSPDDGRLSRTPRICPPAPPTRGGCSTTGRRRPFCLHSRRAGSSAQDSWRTRRQSTKGTEECTSRGSEGLFGSGLTHSSRTYRAVADALEEAVMRKVRERLEMLSPHHVLALLSPIEQSEARELGEMVWSALLYEPGALDDAFSEDEMIDRCTVCLSHQKDAVILPCRHLVICEVCADQIEHRCPYCRGKADEALVVEYPEWPDA
ncbi:Zinc finger, C3HC4 type (RING finger) domain-containing protein [Giardia muris]|uniref:Zinc finger, C3HC4 type (RING finger) domain-containing protein n=1 Tax=Giardia muris TaxID=5742 RepID=A0A4Z1T5C0_GIAMU|nr:Zinc finger, C3HC4 type (RING finger) domain-containing protein [Giardia muris]|eukprot:TNJ28297.1 Zinc finger, C3HC4 type (RING finger) domain-containing protein [Giardia muris]